MNRKLKIQIAEQVRQIRATLRYSAVRPASGITYTLLVLINDSIDKTVPVEKILVSFGIEKHVHHIFAAELENLITGRAVEISPSSVFTGFFKEKFSEYRIADFNLTAAGKVLLEEKQWMLKKLKKK